MAQQHKGTDSQKHQHHRHQHKPLNCCLSASRRPVMMISSGGASLLSIRRLWYPFMLSSSRSLLRFWADILSSVLARPSCARGLVGCLRRMLSYLRRASSYLSLQINKQTKVISLLFSCAKLSCVALFCSFSSSSSSFFHG